MQEGLAEHLDQDSELRHLRELLRVAQSDQDTDQAHFRQEITATILTMRTQYQEEMRIHQHNHDRAQEEMEDKVANLEAACARIHTQI